MRFARPAIILAIALTTSAVLPGPTDASQASVAGNPIYSPYAGTIDSFLAQPSLENFTVLQKLVAADRGYDESSRNLAQMLELYHRKNYRKALDRFRIAIPDLLLSARAHFCAARCHEEMGQTEQQQVEQSLARACLEGLLATGDGSQESPFVVTHTSDEYDLLSLALQTQSMSQSLVQKSGRSCDVLKCVNGKTYWFDVSLSFPNNAPAASADPGKTLPKKAAAEPPATQPAVAIPVKSRLELAEEAYNRGLTAVIQRDYDRCIAEMNDAIERDPLNAEAFLERGFARVEKHQFAVAYGDLCDAIRLRPYFSLAFYERGQCLRLEGDHARRDDAIADYSEAIRLDPKIHYYWRARGMVWFAKQDYGKAIADDSEAIRLKPDDAMSYSNRAFAYQTLGDPAKALDDFNTAIRLRPQLAEAFAGRGFIRLEQANYDLAIGDLSNAANLKPDYADAYSFRSEAFARKGDTQHARADIDRATALRKP